MMWQPRKAVMVTVQQQGEMGDMSQDVNRLIIVLNNLSCIKKSKKYMMYWPNMVQTWTEHSEPEQNVQVIMSSPAAWTEPWGTGSGPGSWPPNLN